MGKVCGGFHQSADRRPRPKPRRSHAGLSQGTKQRCRLGQVGQPFLRRTSGDAGIAQAGSSGKCFAAAPDLFRAADAVQSRLRERTNRNRITPSDDVGVATVFHPAGRTGYGCVGTLPKTCGQGMVCIMSLNSKVSIIIPMFNQAQYVAQAIESALGQNHRNVEVIAVDDGSTDNTPAVAAQFTGRPNFKYIRQENTGLPGARNRGLPEATGDYACFLDSDDYFSPDKTARQAQLLDENPELGFVYCDIVTVDPAGQPAAEQFSIGKISRVLSGNIFQSLMLGGYFPPHTVMIRRSILSELGGFDPELGGHADYDLWLRMSGAGHKTCYQDEPLAFYQIHPDSMSKDGQHMNETRVATFRKIARLHPDAFAESLNHLQQKAQDYFQANQLLRDSTTQSFDGVSPEKQSAAGTAASQTYAFLPHLSEAKLLKGKPDQTAIWEAT